MPFARPAAYQASNRDLNIRLRHRSIITSDFLWKVISDQRVARWCGECLACAVERETIVSIRRSWLTNAEEDAAEEQTHEVIGETHACDRRAPQQQPYRMARQERQVG